MLEHLKSLSNSAGLIACAAAVGASWVAAIASPNCSFDKLTGARADTHVRELLYRTSMPIAALMLISGALFVFATSWVAGSVALVSCFGFFSTRMMLAPKTGRNPRGVRTQRKDQRGYAVMLSLIFTVSAAISALLGAFRV
jgi:hypothetical protein